MRTILKIAVSAVAFVSAVGCVPDDTPVLLRSARSLEGTADACKISENRMSRASWDVASPRIVDPGIHLENQLGAVIEQSSIPNTEIDNTSNNDAILDTIHFDYSSNPSIGLPATEDQARYIVIEANGSYDILGLALFGPKAEEAARGGVAPGDLVEVNVGIQFEGRLRAWPGRIKTNRMVFPVSLFNSGFTGCMTGEVLGVSDTCGRIGGVNGAPLGCCPADKSDCLVSQ